VPWSLVPRRFWIVTKFVTKWMKERGKMLCPNCLISPTAYVLIQFLIMYKMELPIINPSKEWNSTFKLQKEGTELTPIPCLCNTRCVARAAASLALKLPDAIIWANSWIISSWTCACTLPKELFVEGAAFCTLRLLSLELARCFASRLGSLPANSKLDKLNL